MHTKASSLPLSYTPRPYFQVCVCVVWCMCVPCVAHVCVVHCVVCVVHVCVVCVICVCFWNVLFSILSQACNAREALLPEADILGYREFDQATA